MTTISNKILFWMGVILLVTFSFIGVAISEKPPLYTTLCAAAVIAGAGLMVGGIKNQEDIYILEAREIGGLDGSTVFVGTEEGCLKYIKDNPDWSSQPGFHWITHRLPYNKDSLAREEDYHTNPIYYNRDGDQISVLEGGRIA